MRISRTSSASTVCNGRNRSRSVTLSEVIFLQGRSKKAGDVEHNAKCFRGAVSLEKALQEVVEGGLDLLVGQHATNGCAGH